MEVNESENDSIQIYEFEGQKYDSYQEMVAAKRKRNQDWLEQSGLLRASSEIRESKRAQSIQPGLDLVGKKKKTQEPTTKRRKSNRLAGVEADGLYVDGERSGKFQIAGSSNTDVDVVANTAKLSFRNEQSVFYNNRINHGDDLDTKEAVELCGEKWINENSVSEAERFATEHLCSLISPAQAPRRSHTSVVKAFDHTKSQLVAKLDKLSVDKDIAKVTPDRIYSVVCHPSPDSLIVCAGDKFGHVGLWNVDQFSTSKSAVYLYHAHNRPVSCLEWISSGQALLSASYDGSVRWMDVESQKFSQIFATYDFSSSFNDKVGYGLDEGSKSWVQYCTPDSRYSLDKCFFLSTSNGKVFHLDLRAKGIVTFHEDLSEKKINTLSLHPNGNLLASAGLDCTLKIWDVRKLGDSRQARKGRNKAPVAVSEYNAGKSINSAFFSPSGKALLSTAMTDKLEIFADPHLSKGKMKPEKRVHHNNHTGRWLCTFMARWHPSLDVFVVGSMQQPRTIEVFDSDGDILCRLQGEALTAVASRCCFHPSSERLVVVGGNSSGRVCVAREA